MATPKPKPNLLTEEQNDAFDIYVRAWQEKLSLHGWRIERSRKKTKEMAQVEMDHKSLLASYRTGNFGSTPITAETLEGTVIHELLHVLLYKIVNQTEIGLTGEALESEEHNVIHVLEKLLSPTCENSR